MKLLQTLWVSLWLVVVRRSSSFQPTTTGLASRCILHHPVSPRPSASTPPCRLTELRASVTTAQEEEQEPSGGTATIPDEIFNLVKGIVGAGVLTLPSGIAAFANAPSAVYPAVFLIVVIGALSGYGFGLIGRVCALTDTTSFREAWSESVSPRTSWMPAWSVTLKTAFAVLAYSMILGDTFSTLALSAGYSVSRTAALAGITTTVILPLCLLRDLSSLAPFSLLGSLGMLYTAVAMGVRYLDKTYLPPKGRFATDLAPHLRPSFGTTGSAISPATTILIGMLSTAYMAHFNAPKFYVELKNNTVPRFLKVVSSSFAVAIGLFATMASLGFLTFGGNASGLILNNYSPKDAWMGMSRIAVALSIVFSYPLAFVGMRDGVLDLLQIKNRSNRFLNSLTVGLLSGISVLASIIPDVSFVLAFAGYALLLFCCCFVLFPLCVLVADFGEQI